MEPVTPEFIESVIERERPDALLPTLGGQTGLNAAVELAKRGVLERYGVEMIGCDLAAIERGEDRKLFNEAMAEIGLEVARSGYAYSIEDALASPATWATRACCARASPSAARAAASRTTSASFAEIVRQGLELSPAGEVLVEESIEGWKEYEMEVMRDRAGNGIIVCSIENLDPMGVHTGDSITVAPAQTLSDLEYQRMRVASLAILEKIGVETGGSNVQFAVNPENGRLVVIEMNPRVSRSSALASKATGFPIAKAAARLAVGYTLDEIVNDITRATPACFEPAIDYCVVKVPRFAFEKFKGADATLTTRMKAVGEIMAIGRTFEEAFGKAVRSLEDGRTGLLSGGEDLSALDDEALAARVATPTEDRVFAVVEALRRGWDTARVHALSGSDPWFVERLRDMVGRARVHRAACASRTSTPTPCGSSSSTARATPRSPSSPAATSASCAPTATAWACCPCMKTVDTCAAEFASTTEYHYKTYEARVRAPGGKPCIRRRRARSRPPTKPKVMILGAGPNRIGQGIEFDYCCVHASYALEARGFETIMVNCNPETVSTDYDTSDRLYFEPLTYEDVMDIVDVERPDGVVVTLGGQTPLKLARALRSTPACPSWAPSPTRSTWPRTASASAPSSTTWGSSTRRRARRAASRRPSRVAARIGFPLLVRPSYVLGGRGMTIAYDEEHLRTYMAEAVRISPDYPVYLDRFLEGAIECDVDALCDGDEVYIGGILEHIEEAGIHSGDSATCIPPFTFSDALVQPAARHHRAHRARALPCAVS